MERISHYRLVARLGKGAMGEVWRAVDERLGRAVALKLLPVARSTEQKIWRRNQDLTGCSRPLIWRYAAWAWGQSGARGAF